MLTDLLSVETEVQRVLATINQVFVFQIPPQTSAAGHRADSWPSTPAWTGRLQVSSVGEDAVIELKDPNTGALFAACPIKAGGPPAIQKEKTQLQTTTATPPVDYSLKEGQTIRIKLNTKKKDAEKAEEDDDLDPFGSSSSPKKASSSSSAGGEADLLGFSNTASTSNWETF
ncbi:unnamed protein product [Phytophthora lilii]|uniref:Unnamed protein product n=1 Tax=Phytophthora lilii TaxID=2077276 RepID=A0A9W6TKT4_9STRA|nr:unnamed protein product [Phytophthora lilii]